MRTLFKRSETEGEKTGLLTTYTLVFFSGENRFFSFTSFLPAVCILSWVRLFEIESKNNSTKSLLPHIGLRERKKKTIFKRPNSSAPFDVRKKHNYASTKHVLFIAVTRYLPFVTWLQMDFFLFTKAIETHVTHKGCRRSDLITAVSSHRKRLFTRTSYGLVMNCVWNRPPLYTARDCI